MLPPGKSILVGLCGILLIISAIAARHRTPTWEELRTVTDGMRLVAFDSSTSTSIATATCAPVLDMVRSVFFSAPVPLGLCYLTLDHWLYVCAVRGIVGRD